MEKCKYCGDAINLTIAFMPEDVCWGCFSKDQKNEIIKNQFESDKILLEERLKMDKFDDDVRKHFGICSLELAKRLKQEGYSKNTEWFYQDKDLSFVLKGLKKTKNGLKMNHNKYDDFIYSAPTTLEAVEWLHGKNIKYENSVTVVMNKKI